jgi:transposase-like protein
MSFQQVSRRQTRHPSTPEPSACRGAAQVEGRLTGNLLAKIPAGMQAEVKDAYWKIFDTEDLKTPPGPKLVEIIDARIGELAAKYQGTYPAAAKILLTDREGLTAYLRFPAEHHHRVRHSNFIWVNRPWEARLAEAA